VPAIFKKYHTDRHPLSLSFVVGLSEVTVQVSGTRSKEEGTQKHLAAVQKGESEGRTLL